MLKAIKIRLYPNNDQEDYIANLLGSYRKVYNLALSHKKEMYDNDKTNVNLKELGAEFHNNWTKSDDYFYLKEHNTKVLKQAVINVLDSYKRFFKNGNGRPKFKSKHNNKQSCRFPIDAISTKNDYNSNKLTLTKQLKNIKFRTSDRYKKYLTKHKDNIRSATLTRTRSGNYYLSILVDGDLTKTLPKSNNDIIGLDLGIKDFIVTSENTKFENIKVKRNNEKKLIKLNRDLSKKQKGSNNKNKCRIKLAKYHERLNNKKENYLHHITNQLLDENQVIVIEDLNVSGMMKNHKLAKSIQELSLYRFKEMLRYKSKWYGRDLIEIDRYYPSSKLCSSCGFKNNNLKLSDREWECPKCEVTHDRDYNAAINIRNEGQRIMSDNNDRLNSDVSDLKNSNLNSDRLNSDVSININNNDSNNNIMIGYRLPELTPLESNSVEPR